MTLKPGTLCVVIHALLPEALGMECTVLESPRPMKGLNPMTNQVELRVMAKVELSNGNERLFPPTWLLPINPDPDDDYIQKEKDKPLENEREKVYVE